ncbi:cytochrome P450 [Rickenella mellea]|uniref:Cytochrome P450 n=1 Tax=Rickenella mellea TaxID=50990 RepID=A0A4Y7Q6A6_9AGAM|nr:cytochrome P450 [Rickenella mellea]
MQNLYLVALSFVLLYAVRKLIDYRRNIKAIRNFPGYRTAIPAASILGNLLPRIPGIVPGRLCVWEPKHGDFDYFGCDMFSSISLFPNRIEMSVCDATTIKEITSSRARWPKPIEQYGALNFFGKNIITTEDDEWKKHRKVANPAFSERNNKMVWEETVKIVNEMFNTIWKDKKEVVVEHCVDITLPLALLVIGTAGFGRAVSWEEDFNLPPGHKMSFKQALHFVSTGLFWKVIFPNWAMGLHKKLREVRLAFKELETYMQEMIDERRNAVKKVERFDLFTSLLDASEGEDDGGTKLSDSELRGNIFIFMLAGHETTAHTLSYCFGLLAMYQDEQEKLYQHIKSVLSDGRAPTYSDMNALNYSTAVFYETLRIFPPVTAIPKMAAEDTTLVVGNQTGEKRTVVIPKGTEIMLHMPGLHYNPRYWKDPHEFKPQRFLEDYNRDAFLPFSGGARQCLGRKFFETEGIAILTNIVQKYKIEVKEEPQFANETFDERRARIFKCTNGLTLTPVRVPLVFKRRD